METLLHVEPLTRHISQPLSVGSNGYVFYGSQDTADGENVGHSSDNICLGSPLFNVDPGSVKNQIPLVKTVGKIPNYFIKGDVITETIHYQDGQTLIPVRMKLRSGFGDGMSVSHLPSLNLTRRRLGGNTYTRVIDPRSEIVESLLHKKVSSKWGIKPWVSDWVQDDMIPRLRGITHTTSSLSTHPVETMIDNYLAEISDIPNEISVQNAQHIWQALVPEAKHLPPNFYLSEPITVPLAGLRNQIIPNNHDFRSWGQLQLSRFAQIAHNPKGMEEYTEWFDDLPLTDLNADLVCGMNGEVLFFHCHVAVNRFDSLKQFSSFAEHNGVYLEQELDNDFLSGMLEKFVQCHPCLDRQTSDWINKEVVKIKLLKTMREEAAILLYYANDDGNQEPIAGMYFDLGLQLLAPMSVMEEMI